jgi:hypothetical protein
LETERRTQPRDSLQVLPHRRRHDAGGVFDASEENPRSMSLQSDDQTVDRLKIDVRDAWELRWWCRQFGCTEAQLRTAIDAMGAIAGNVRRYLACERARQHEEGLRGDPFPGTPNR